MAKPTVCNDCFARLWREDRKLPREARSSRGALTARLLAGPAEREPKIRHYRASSGLRIPSQAKCDRCHEHFLKKTPTVTETDRLPFAPAVAKAPASGGPKP